MLNGVHICAAVPACVICAVNLHCFITRVSKICSFEAQSLQIRNCLGMPRRDFLLVLSLAVYVCVLEWLAGIRYKDNFVTILI